MNNAKHDACYYVLTALLQRLEDKNPGLIAELMEGASGDRRALPANIENRDYIEEVHEEAMNLLARAYRPFEDR